MIKPYYENENGKLYCGDCVDIMPCLDRVDLTVTSPPYDNLRDYEGYDFNFKKIAKALYRITKDGGVVVWVVGDATIKGSETGTSFKQALFFKEIGFNLHDTMIYEKNGSAMPTNVRYLAKFEYMFVFSKGMPKSINLIKDRKNRFMTRWGKGRVVRNKDGTLSPRNNYVADEYGVRFNIWKLNNGYGYSTKDEIAFKHPAIFPEKLAYDHIISWSNKGDIILDPMAGSGTALKMAERLNRKWLGIEISEKYCEIVVKRIEDERKQMKLF